MFVSKPIKTPTPYGGRLVWTLPGETRIVCHLKDKSRIRNKKRWSQCMYMYYFASHMIANNHKLSKEQKEKRARNTFLLALDGDMDFQPDSILKLVDILKKSPKVGASCGRIHPTGSGYLQWDQKFEYAAAHWFQKATEHVMGCVLCSPGCFSIFRAKAIMDDNVLKTYTKLADKPMQHIQYDMGEDRWMCNLLLRQGWRIEYSAASDAFTACPEGFKELFNQRKRWSPAGFANNYDLLIDYKSYIKNNEDISMFYILYLAYTMFGSVFGPSSILIAMMGVFKIAYRASDWVSFLGNVIPVGIYVFACVKAELDTQVKLAEIITGYYVIMNVAFVTNLMVDLITPSGGGMDGATMLLIAIIGCFFLAGILHPQETW